MANVTVEKVYMRMTITGTDNVDSITIPEDDGSSNGGFFDMGDDGCI